MCVCNYMTANMNKKNYSEENINDSVHIFIQYKTGFYMKFAHYTRRMLPKKTTDHVEDNENSDK